MSVAVQLNAEIFTPLYTWIRENLRVPPFGSTNFGQGFTARLCADGRKQEVMDVLRDAGIGLEDIVVRERPINFAEMSSALPEAVRAFFASTFKDAMRMEVEFLYTDSSGGLVGIPLEQESDGTQLLFSLIGPLIDVSESGYVIVVDEIHRSLHPVVFRALIERFFMADDDEDRRGQVIFTSHETYVLDNETLHRDEIWFAGKEAVSGTVLTPLSDFRGRSGEEYRKSYLSGRYGSLPKRLPYKRVREQGEKTNG